MSTPDRTAMLDRSHPGLSIRCQCRLLGLARSNLYRPSPAADAGELVIMRQLDELFLAWPFFGSRRMTAMLRAMSKPNHGPPTPESVKSAEP